MDKPEIWTLRTRYSGLNSEKAVMTTTEEPEDAIGDILLDLFLNSHSRVEAHKLIGGAVTIQVTSDDGSTMFFWTKRNPKNL